MNRQTVVTSNTRIEGEWENSPFPEIRPPEWDDWDGNKPTFPTDRIYFYYEMFGDTYIIADKENGFSSYRFFDVNIEVSANAVGYTIWHNEEVVEYQEVGDEPAKFVLKINKFGIWLVTAHYAGTPEYTLNVLTQGITPKITRLDTDVEVVAPVDLPVGTHYTIEVVESTVPVNWVRNGVIIFHEEVATKQEFVLSENTSHTIARADVHVNVVFNVVNGTGFLSLDEEGLQEIPSTGQFTEPLYVYIHTTPNNPEDERASFTKQVNGQYVDIALNEHKVWLDYGTTVLNIVYGVLYTDINVLVDVGGVIVTNLDTDESFGSNSQHLLNSKLKIELLTDKPILSMVQFVDGEETKLPEPETNTFEYTMPTGGSINLIIRTNEYDMAGWGVRVYATSTSGTNPFPPNSNFLGLFGSSGTGATLFNASTIYNQLDPPHIPNSVMPEMRIGIVVNGSNMATSSMHYLQTAIGQVRLSSTAGINEIRDSNGVVLSTSNPTVTTNVTTDTANQQTINRSTWAYLSPLQLPDVLTVFLGGATFHVVGNARDAFWIQTVFNGVTLRETFDFPRRPDRRALLYLHIRRDLSFYHSVHVFNRVQNGVNLDTTLERGGYTIDKNFREYWIRNGVYVPMPDGVSRDYVEFKVRNSNLPTVDFFQSFYGTQGLVIRPSLTEEGTVGDIIGSTSGAPASWRLLYYRNGNQLQAGMHNNVGFSLRGGNNLLKLPSGDLIPINGGWVSGALITDGSALTNNVRMDRLGQIRESIMSLTYVEGTLIAGLKFTPVNKQDMLVNCYLNKEGNVVTVFLSRDRATLTRWTTGVDVPTIVNVTSVVDTPLRPPITGSLVGYAISLTTDEKWWYDVISDEVTTTPQRPINTGSQFLGLSNLHTQIRCVLFTVNGVTEVREYRIIPEQAIAIDLRPYIGIPITWIPIDPTA